MELPEHIFRYHLTVLPPVRQNFMTLLPFYLPGTLAYIICQWSIVSFDFY